jgi:tetratricopeptide (TPR) repeat protein
MGIFCSIASAIKRVEDLDDENPITEAELEARCLEADVRCAAMGIPKIVYAPPPLWKARYGPATRAGATPYGPVGIRLTKAVTVADTRIRRLVMFAALDDLDLQEQCRASGVVVFLPALPGETTLQRRQRHRELQGTLAENVGDTDPKLATFFERVLGNLPLAVALCGQMLRAERFTSVSELVARAEIISLDDFSTDTHNSGLARTVKTALKRLESAKNVDSAAKEAAVALLIVLARLPSHGLAASELFRVSDSTLDKDVVEAFTKFEAAQSPPPATVVDLFRESAWSTALAPACELLQQYGLIQLAVAGVRTGPSLGSMQQMVQRYVREYTFADDGITSSTLTWARAVLTVCYSQQWKDEEGPLQRLRGMRALDVCVETWCRWSMEERAGEKEVDGKAMEAAAADAQLLGTFGRCIGEDDGVANKAKELHQMALAFLRRVLPEEHPSIATSMNNLANMYSQLERYLEALKLQEGTLLLRQRVLPEDHPDIATSMNNLAFTYGALGRHEDALKLQEETLAFRRRVLRKDHPDIATSLGHLAQTYGKLGRHQDALKLQEETLAFRRRVLPKDHPDIATSMGHLAQTY